MFTPMGNTYTATVIPCGATKLPHAAKARELYIGSMFKDALRTADQLGAPVFILSALHGLLPDSQVVEPYNVKMGQKNSIVNELQPLREQLTQLIQQGVTELDCFLPKQYFSALDTASAGLAITLKNHFAGTKGIGFQKAVLKQFRIDTVAA
jgi:cytoplasmic iron level regulating protein YaaA (DUF328/UPF0246 family)